MAHHWKHSIARGVAGEKLVQEWMAQWWHVVRVTDIDRQRIGIDFDVTDGKHSWTVEVKSCSQGDTTGNIFLETVSVAGTNGRETKLGWLHTCQADWLYYLLVHSRRLFVCRTDALRMAMPVWQAYPEKTVENVKYHGRGYVVPVDVFERHAEMVVRL